MNSGLEKLKKITKNRSESIRLLESALEKDTFLKYLLNYFNERELLDLIDFSSFKEKLSENEFQQLHPKYHYKPLWKTLNKQKFTAINATNPIYWLSITYQAIKNDIIKPYYLAYENNNKNGKENIIKALRLSKKGDDKKLFDICRAILRHTFGSIQERGKKGIYQDVPFAIIWWRIHLAKEISSRTKIDEVKIYEYFDKNPTNYNELIMRMSSKLTVIADKNIRDGFFEYFIEKNLTDTKNFKQIIKIIGIESSWRAMGSLSIEENKKIIESLAA